MTKHFNQWVWGATGMAVKGVNLDALIPRDDLAVGDGIQSGESGDHRLGHAHFQKGFFLAALRKPEFQRETVHWPPTKIVELVEAFVDNNLIPAVILWQAGKYNFVVDGAHRLSALLAWIHNDYGDGDRSKALFGPVPPEQQEMADKTRQMIDKRVKPYKLYEAALDYPQITDEKTKVRISNLSRAHFVAQWVPAATKEGAEASFFKINDAATPLEPTEKRILQSRGSASAISSRAIAHGGTGYKYWGHFPSEERREKIVALGSKIYNLLYRPPIGPGAIDTLDVPVAGRGYSILPFVFDLVNSVNATKAGDSTRTRTKDDFPKDLDGQQTLEFLQTTERAVTKITGKDSTSLGLHPVIYFYTQGGSFSPWAFLAWSRLINELFDKNRTIQFCDYRPAIEDFLEQNKWAMTEIIHKNGSGYRSTPWLEQYWRLALNHFMDGEIASAVAEKISATERFKFLQFKPPILRLPGEGTKKRFTKSTLTATFWGAALPGAPRCSICGAKIHRNSTHGEHALAKRDGGDSRPENAGIAHPYCDSTYKDIKAKR